LGDNHKDVDSESADFGFSFFWITAENKPAISALPPLEYNELLFLAPKGPSVCKDTAAFVLKDGSVEIFAKQNNRPSRDYVAVIVYSPIQNKVLTSKRNLGISDEIEKISDAAVAMRIHDTPSDAVTPSVTVQGHKSNAREETFDYWQLIEFNENKISSKTDPKLTWEKTRYRPYFKSQKSFDEAFRWNEKTGNYENLWVYRVTEPDCIQPSKPRFASSVTEWFCAQKTK
jgi:hypothetical protein